MEIFEVEGAADEHWASLRRLIVAYNSAQVRHAGYVGTLALGLRSEPGGVSEGGLWGEIYWNWLTIHLLVVPEGHRRRGLGSSLLRHAEEFAQARGCVGVWLNTFSFQAPEFYRMRGYEPFGELAPYPDGAGLIFFRKLLARPEAASA